MPAHCQDDKTAEQDRISSCLKYIQDHPAARFPSGWVAQVQAEALAAGLIAPPPASIGCNCQPSIDRAITYGGDLEEVF